MKVLCMVPNYVPSYFNAGHHLWIFQVGAYLRKHLGTEAVDCIDACAIGMSWKDMGRLCLTGYDLAVMLNDFDAIDTFERTVDYFRTLSPGTKLMTVGRLGQQLPHFFERFGFDAVHWSGNPEAAAWSYIGHLLDPGQPAKGCLVKVGDRYEKHSSGPFLGPEEWCFPDVKELPLEANLKWYGNDMDKFCGIPDRLELVVPVARGCPVGCEFCDVPKMQGSRERRVSVASVIEYVEKAKTMRPVEYVSFYAPTFTLDRKWVIRLCDEVFKRGLDWRWKCVTTIHHIDDQLLELMSASGCIRVSLGIETLFGPSVKSLPSLKRCSEERFRILAESCRKHGIELNCFVILGLPGERLEDAVATIRAAQEMGCRVRPTIYTPYDRMKDSMSTGEIARFNRQFLLGDGLDAGTVTKLQEMSFRIEDDRPTRVMEAIPVVRK